MYICWLTMFICPSLCITFVMHPAAHAPVKLPWIRSAALLLPLLGVSPCFNCGLLPQSWLAAARRPVHKFRMHDLTISLSILRTHVNIHPSWLRIWHRVELLRVKWWFRLADWNFQHPLKDKGRIQQTQSTDIQHNRYAERRPSSWIPFGDHPLTLEWCR